MYKTAQGYNSERLTGILCDVTDIIGANVLNISKQDYDPQGASVTLLISEKATDSMEIDKSCNRGMVDGKPLHPQRNGAGKALSSETVVAHLDKSHVTVHTYPEYHPNNSISTFRVDIDVSTCGEISPPERACGESQTLAQANSLECVHRVTVFKHYEVRYINKVVGYSLPVL